MRGERHVSRFDALKDSVRDFLALRQAGQMTNNPIFCKRFFIQACAIRALRGHQAHGCNALRMKLFGHLLRHMQQLKLRKALLQTGMPSMCGVASNRHAARTERR